MARGAGSVRCLLRTYAVVLRKKAEASDRLARAVKNDIVRNVGKQHIVQ